MFKKERQKWELCSRRLKFHFTVVTFPSHSYSKLFADAAWAVFD